MNPLFQGLSRDEVEDSSPSCKRLKISNLVWSTVEDELQTSDRPWVFNDASDTYASDDFVIDDFLETGATTPRLVEDSLDDICYGMVRSSYPFHVKQYAYSGAEAP